MPIEILMPALSPTMEEGTLANWLVTEGDTVASGDVIAEIETDKATMEFEAVDEGTIGQLLVASGTSGVKVNTPIAVLLEDGETSADLAETPSPATAPSPAPASPAITPDATPATQPEPAPAGDAGKEAAPARGSDAPAPHDTGTSAQRIFASPLARRIAEQKGLDLNQISGTGPHGRIVKADVEAAVPQPASATTPTPTPQAAAPAPQSAQTAPAKDPSAAASTIAALYADRDYSEVPLDGMRKTIAARLTEAKQEIPHFYLRRDVHLDALLAFRSELNSQLSPRGVKLSVNDFVIKACAAALQQVPAANAVWAGDRIFQLTPSDVAVAVAVEGGLFTPVLRDSDTKSLSALSAEMKDLAARARDRKLAPHEYQGGSFAISNLGMFGIDSFDAVINPPHGAILAVGAGSKRPVVQDDGTLGVATVMSLTLSVDHRVIDGALAAELLTAIKEGLETPMTLLV